MPKRTQEELAVLQELILSNLTNVRMIILYGSYARGKYVIWNNTQTDILPKQEERRYAKTLINE